jgi:hypothetical protein
MGLPGRIKFCREGAKSMDYVIDLDPTHLILRVTIGKVLTDELSLEIYRTVKRLASRGGPYAGIFDLSKVEDYRRSPEIAAKLVTDPPIPGERLCAIVAKPTLHEHFRVLELTRNWMGGHWELVHSMDEAYGMLGVRPEDFTERLFPKKLAA